MAWDDEARTLRSRMAELEAEMGRLDSEPSDGDPAMLVQTFDDGDYPVGPDAYHACHPIDVGGVEAENEAVTFDVSTAAVYCLNAGTTVPPAGTKLIVRAIDGRWVFAYHGAEEVP
jgi:hypothetical protein